MAILRKRKRGNDDAAESNHIRHIQIVVGSYEHVLQGVQATAEKRTIEQAINGDEGGSSSENRPGWECRFKDSFLLSPHTAAIRCLALSAPSKDSEEQNSRILATGGNDERINLYSLSTHPPDASRTNPLKTITSKLPSERVQNKELGFLLHHSAAVTALHFPTRSKLISASEDNSIAISRTRDWVVLSTIKTPRRKAIGQPSGDTSTANDLPSGTNDFAIHPSSKLMITVGRAEKCMRLWNLVTGKKTNVLNFDKKALSAVGESRYSSGEGRRIVWNAAGSEFAVAFEKGILVYSLDCIPRARVILPKSVKIHQVCYVRKSNKAVWGFGEECSEVLAFSTEDGRLLFADPAVIASVEKPEPSVNGASDPEALNDIPRCKILGFVAAKDGRSRSRIKDFVILGDICVAGCSDGTILVWLFNEKFGVDEAGEIKSSELIGQYATNLRITCLIAFFMGGEVAAPMKRASHTPNGDQAEWSGFQ